MRDITDITRQYPRNEGYMEKYIEYQKKYSMSIRESDKVIIEILKRSLVNESLTKVLDIGCSTGNLLSHLNHFFPTMKLVGGDLSDLQIESCKNNLSLKSIEFRVADITNLNYEAEFDYVIANAVLCGLEDDDFSLAAESISKALKPEGALIAFDWFHPWKQELTILEKSGNLPEGYVLHFRSYNRVRELLSLGGYQSINFMPFEIKINLPQPDFQTNFLETYTIPTSSGELLQFRGVINQPWNHMLARK
jgi:SAM-dependent methyltransferase